MAGDIGDGGRRITPPLPPPPVGGLYGNGFAIIIGGGFVIGWNPGGGRLVIINILVNGIELVNRTIGQFVRIIGGSDWAGIMLSFHFHESATVPFTTVHVSLNVPSPVTGAFSLVVP